MSAVIIWVDLAFRQTLFEFGVSGTIWVKGQCHWQPFSEYTSDRKLYYVLSMSVHCHLALEGPIGLLYYIVPRD